MPISRKTETEFKIKKLALEGMSARGIAKEVSMSNTTVSNYLRKLGMTNTSSYKLTDEEITDIMNEKYPTFEYIGGYKGANNKMIVRCRVCGHEFKYTAQNLRPSRNANMQCRECNKRISEQKKDNEKLLKETTRQATKQIAEQERQIARLKELKEREIVKVCVECGEEFITVKTNVICCSGECAKKRANNKKDRRLRKCDVVDYSITLTKLVKRDKGICYICGEKVDMDAHGNSDWYGSIDHVKAIANGGNHTWDNVKLAHRKCNILKRDDKQFINRNQ